MGIVVEIGIAMFVIGLQKASGTEHNLLYASVRKLCSEAGLGVLSKLISSIFIRL